MSDAEYCCICGARGVVYADGRWFCLGCAADAGNELAYGSGEMP